MPQTDTKPLGFVQFGLQLRFIMMCSIVAAVPVLICISILLNCIIVFLGIPDESTESTNNNGTNTVELTEKELERRSLAEKILYSFLFLIVGFAGVIGNGLVILVILKDPALQIKSQLSNMFILNLAITDLICSSFVTIPGGVNIICDETPFPRPICVYFAWCNIVTIMCTYLTLLVISFDRFIAVGWSLHYPQWVTEHRMYYILVMVWIHCFISASSLTILPNFSVYDYWAGICDVDWVDQPWVKLLTLFHGSTIFAIPTVFIIGLNISIVVMSREKGRVGSLQSEGSKVNSRILIAMMVVIVFYILLNCPTGVIRMTKVSLNGQDSFPNWFTNLAQVFTLSASFVNPLIYGLFRKDFQVAFKKYGKDFLNMWR